MKLLVGAIVAEEDSLRLVLGKTNWLYVCLAVGAVAAIGQLLIVADQSVCLLFAAPRVRGLDVTLPEAFAAVRAEAWYGIVLTPLAAVITAAIVGVLTGRISAAFGGSGSFYEHFGMLTIAAAALILGRLVGYLFLALGGTGGVTVPADLTPGIGFGLLPSWTAGRAGGFLHEIARGFDLFGIWTIVLCAALHRVINGFGRLKSYFLAFGMYSTYLAVRWVIEGPGHNVWNLLFQGG